MQVPADIFSTPLLAGDRATALGGYAFEAEVTSLRLPPAEVEGARLPQREARDLLGSCRELLGRCQQPPMRTSALIAAAGIPPLPVASETQEATAEQPPMRTSALVAAADVPPLNMASATQKPAVEQPPMRTSGLVFAAATAASLAGDAAYQPERQRVPPSRSPLTPRAAPQPSAAPFVTPRCPEVTKKPAVNDVRYSWDEELSTRPPSTMGSQRQSNCNSPRQSSPRPSTRHRSPPKPSTPRQRMSDYIHGPNSPIQFPEVMRRINSEKRNRSPNTFRETARHGSGARYTTPLISPRNLAGDGYPRAGLSTSNSCVEWLRDCASNTRVEDLVEDMLDQQDDVVRRTEEYRFARNNLRNPSYRDATKCATSMARRTKPPQAWR